MIFDIGACIIAIISGVFYYKKGFAYSILNILQWFFAIVMSLLLCDNLYRFIVKNTGLGNSLCKTFDSKINSGGTQGQQMQVVFDSFHRLSEKDSAIVSNPNSEDIALIVISIFMFFIILIAVKLLMWKLCKLFPKERFDGFLGFINQLSAIPFGVIFAFLYILLFLTFLTAIIPLIPASGFKVIEGIFGNSIFIGSLFNNNFLLLLIGNLFA